MAYILKSNSNKRSLYVLIILSLSLISACTDPVQKTESLVTELQKEWDAANQSYTPLQRLDHYDAIIATLEGIKSDYPETPIAQSLVSRGQANGVSLRTYKMMRDKLAARAECFESPSVECLMPFATAEFKGSVNTPSAQIAQADAICQQDFQTTLGEIDNKRINKRLYADELIQMGFRAADCKNDETVKLVIAEYLKAEPATGAQRVNKIAQILNTPAFEAGSDKALTNLESLMSDQALPAGTRATIGITLAQNYIKRNQAQRALEKYNFVTKTLGFRVQESSEIGRNLITLGLFDEGMSIALSGIATNAKESQRLSLLNTTLTSLNQTITFSDEELGASASGIAETHTQLSNTEIKELVAKLQSKLTEFAVDEWLMTRPTNLIMSYSNLALIYSKLGKRSLAATLFQRSEQMYTQYIGNKSRLNTTDKNIRIRMLENQLVRANSENNLSSIIKTLVELNKYKTYQILSEVNQFVSKAVAANEIELVINSLSQLSPQDQGAYYYSSLVDAAIKQEKTEYLEAIIDAAPGNERQKINYAYRAISAFADSGNYNLVERYKAKYLDNDPGYTYLLKAHSVAGNDSRIKELLTEMFEKGAYENINNGEIVNLEQAASREAFIYGFTELGIAFYKKAKVKDYNPLLSAFSEKNTVDKYLTEILMLAHDHASDYQASVVTNYAIGYLSKNKDL